MDKRDARPAPAVPLSWGELADKISILQIKRERIPSPVQRANIMRELEAIAPIIDSLTDAPTGLDAIRAELKSVNEKLWDIEDAIRAKEAGSAFDDEFIALARAVYKTNDLRARIKRRINDLMCSSLVEEKHYHEH